MRRAEALEELARRYRMRLALVVGHNGAWRNGGTGATMAATPAELRTAAHELLDVMLNRYLELDA